MLSKRTARGVLVALCLVVASGCGATKESVDKAPSSVATPPATPTVAATGAPTGAPKVTPVLPGAAHALAIHPADPHVVLVVANGALQRTEDGGDHWAVVLPKPEGSTDQLWGVGFDPYDPAVAWALSGHHAYRSADSGRTWVQLAAYSTALQDFAFDARDSHRIITSTWSSSPGTVEWTHDQAKWWQNANGLPDKGHYRLAVLPTRPNELLAIEVEHGELFRSADGGRTFAAASSPGKPLPFGPDYASPLLVEPTKGVLYYGMQQSTDAGITWAPLPAPASDAYLLAVGMGDVPQLLATVWNMSFGLFFSADGGKNWLEIGQDLNHPQVFAAAFGKDGTLWLATGSGLFRIGKVNGVPPWVKPGHEIEYQVTHPNGPVDTSKPDLGMVAGHPISEAIRVAMNKADIHLVRVSGDTKSQSIMLTFKDEAQLSRIVEQVGHIAFDPNPGLVGLTIIANGEWPLVEGVELHIDRDEFMRVDWAVLRDQPIDKVFPKAIINH